MTPEERELERKRVDLAQLETLLVQRELDLATLRGELQAFERRYYQTVGVRYAELDQVEAELAAESAEDAETARRRAQISLQECLRYNARLPHPGHESEDLKKLYREAARKLHPDLCEDESQRGQRGRLMAEANLAYQQGNEERLRSLLSEWELQPAAVDGVGTVAELVRVIRATAVILDRLDRIETETAALAQSATSALRNRAGEAGRDVLQELAGQLEWRSRQARARLANGPNWGVSTGALHGENADLIARGLTDLAGLEGRLVLFPQDRPVGELSIRDQNNIQARRETLGAAWGPVVTPRGKALLFHPDPQCIDFSWLAGLRSGDLHGFLDEWPRFAGIGDRDLAHLANMKSLQELNLGRTRVTDAGLKSLGGLRALKVLLLDETALTDRGLEHLPSFPALEKLDLAHTRITDAGLKSLKCLPMLRELSLYGTGIGDRGLASLRRLRSLRNLNLGLTGITGHGLRYLKSLRLLEVLHLGGTKVDDDGLAHLEGLHYLRDLVLWETKVSDEGLRLLENFRSLRYLDTDHTQVTPHGWKRLARFLRNLRGPQDVWSET
ncbi:MAG: hypothetical protein WD696_20375 [Bryobacteraceae bacterium]